MGPTGLNNTVTIIAHQLSRVRTIGTVYFYAIAYSNKAKNIITGYRVAAIGELVINFLHLFANQKDIAVLGFYIPKQTVHLFGFNFILGFVFDYSFRCLVVLKVFHI